MNPKVKELAEKAGGMVLAGSEIEKFAELIVKECMELNSGEMGFPAWQDLARIYREHFGVEE